MSRIHQALCLVLLLIAGQQGALNHELGHLTGAQNAGRSAESPKPADPLCALCAEYAQASSPTFAYSFDLPPIARAAHQAIAAARIKSADASVPTARSRGPPYLS
jgi:hypothetical protein